MSAEEPVPGGGRDLLEQLSRDHAEIDEGATGILTSPAADLASRLWRYGDRVIRHEVAEETVVYPVLVTLTQGAAAAHALQQEQAALESALVAAEDLEGASEEAMAALGVVVGAVRAHHRAEEQWAWPILADRLSSAERYDLAQRYAEVRDTPPRLSDRSDAGPTIVGRFTALATWLRDSSAAIARGL